MNFAKKAAAGLKIVREKKSVHIVPHFLYAEGVAPP